MVRAYCFGVVAKEYDELVAAAAAAPIDGWDFSWLDGRATGSQPTWSYPDLARELLRDCRHALDVDTGGGEVLAALDPPAGRVWATEDWSPNVDVARRRLTPLGVTVVPSAAGRLPFRDEEFDLVLNRHGHLDAAEAARVLATGGTLISQQVGSDDCMGLNEVLEAPTRRPGARVWGLTTATAALTRAALNVIDAREEWPILTFYDIGAVVYQLRLVSWQIPGFTVERYDGALRRLDAHIRTSGCLEVRTHRFLIIAHKPAAPGLR